VLVEIELIAFVRRQYSLLYSPIFRCLWFSSGIIRTGKINPNMSADKVTSSCTPSIKEEEETDDEVAASSYSPSEVKVEQENKIRLKSEEETTDDEDNNMKKMPSPVKSYAPSPVASAKLKEECYDAPTPPLKMTEDNSNISLESMDDDILLKILQYIPNDSAKLGLLNNKWRMQKNQLWKILAIKRWGNGVVDNNKEHSSINWYQYYYQRCSTSGGIIPNETSHLDLIQEQYIHDPYHMLTACILSSRTSGGINVRRIVSDFLKKYPTPTLVINADISTMEAELCKLGLNREKTMKQFADGFLKPWDNITKLRGCAASLAGPSLTVFCHGDYKSVLKDKKAHPNVKAYASYLKKKVNNPSKREVVISNEEISNNAYLKKRKRVKKSSKTTAPIRRMTRNR